MHYRCFQCGCEIWVNEAIIDFDLGYSEFKGSEVIMPVLGCPGCNRETMKYTRNQKFGRRALSSWADRSPSGLVIRSRSSGRIIPNWSIGDQRNVTVNLFYA